MNEKAEKKRPISTTLAPSSVPYTGKMRYKMKNGHEAKKRLRLSAPRAVAGELPEP